jgi:hypothetical protein
LLIAFGLVIRGHSHKFFLIFFTFPAPTFSIEFFISDRSYVYLEIKLLVI